MRKREVKDRGRWEKFERGEGKKRERKEKNDNIKGKEKAKR